MATLPALLGRLDANPVRRGRQFERICAWWLTHDPGYRTLVKRGRGRRGDRPVPSRPGRAAGQPHN
jgi:hypothetical protein